MHELAGSVTNLGFFFFFLCLWVESNFGRGQESALAERFVWLFFGEHIVGVSNSLSSYANYRFSELISMVTKFNRIPL